MFRLAVLLLPCIAGCTNDRDGDGYDEGVDCDDTNAAVNPGATEVRGNAWDDDCDGDIAAWLWVGTYGADAAFDDIDDIDVVATLEVDALGTATLDAVFTGPDNDTITYSGSGSAGPGDDEETFAFGTEGLLQSGAQSAPAEISGNCELQEPALDCSITVAFLDEGPVAIPFVRE